MITVVGNLKGGSGKSTVAFNLALWMLDQGEDVVAFDLDPQSTLSDVSEVRYEEAFDPPLTVFRSESDPIKILKEHKGQALVDVGASNLWAMRQAISMADRILVPVPPSQADVWSTQRFLTMVAEAARDNDPEIILFINRADTHPGLRETDETAEALETLPGVRVLGERLGQRTAYRRSFSEGLGVFEMAPSSKAAKEFGKLAKRLSPKKKAGGKKKKKK